MNLLSNLREKKNFFLKKENIYYLIIVILIFFFDRYTKSIIVNDFNGSVYFINEYINLNLIWNTGIGFGLLSSESSLFYNLITMTIGLVIIVIFYAFFNSNSLDKLIYTFIIGGALGNFFDRLIYKAVPDFIDLHYNNFNWFIFNVADIFITLGIGLLIFDGLFRKN